MIKKIASILKVRFTPDTDQKIAAEEKISSAIPHIPYVIEYDEKDNVEEKFRTALLQHLSKNKIYNNNNHMIKSYALFNVIAKNYYKNNN